MSTDYSFPSPFQQHQTPCLQNDLNPFLDTPRQSDSHSWNNPSGSSNAYMRSNYRIQSLECKIQCLKVENISLTATRNTYEYMHTFADNSAEQPSTPLPQQFYQKFRPPISSFTGLNINGGPLNRHDYLKTQFWTEDMYTEWSKTPAFQWTHENCTACPFLFLKDTDGKLVMKAEASNILKMLRNVWHTLLNNNCAPDTWGRAGAEVLDDIADEMARHHPILALCSNGWKVQAIATERYPSWASTHIKKRKKSSDAVVSSGTKRKITKLSDVPSESCDDSSPPSNHLAKRSKVDETDVMAPLATLDPTVSATVATTLLTSPTDSDQSSSESEHLPTTSECARATSPPAEVILKDTQNTLYSTASLPQIKNLLAKLVLSKKPNPLEPPSALAPPMSDSTNDPTPQNPDPTVLPVLPPMVPATDTVLPMPTAAGTTDDTSDIATTKEAAQTTQPSTLPAVQPVPTVTAQPLAQAHANPPASSHWYTITVGRETGVFQGWHSAHVHVVGVPGACFARHPTHAAAEGAYTEALAAGGVTQVLA
ncbi:hypothetical protein BDR05DRAFT_1005134 [Suillus weaverae]|nr:hypothetical protein BDR05DRAFT_1005134 [Suillus weaverae]